MYVYMYGNVPNYNSSFLLHLFIKNVCVMRILTQSDF